VCRYQGRAFLGELDAEPRARGDDRRLTALALAGGGIAGFGRELETPHQQRMSVIVDDACILNGARQDLGLISGIS